MAKKKLRKRAAFSKLLVMTVFIFLCILGLYLYIPYRQDQQLGHMKSFHQPNKLVVSRLENKRFNLAPFTRTITDATIIRRLYTELDAFKVLPPNTAMGCPMIPAGYQAVRYDLVFYKDTTVLRHVVFSPPGCRGSLKLENNAVAEGVTIESVGFEKTLQQTLHLSAVEFRGYGRD